MTGIYEEIQLEREFGTAFVFHRIGELKDANVILTNLPIDCPTCLAFIAIDGGSDGKVCRVLLMICSRVDQLDGLPLTFFAGFLGEHADIAEGDVAIGGSSRSVAFHRLVRKGLDTYGGHSRQGHLGRYHPTVILGILAGKKERSIALSGKGGAVERLGLGIVQSSPNGSVRVFAFRIVQPVFETLRQFLSFEFFPCLKQGLSFVFPFRQIFTVLPRVHRSINLATYSKPEGRGEAVIVLGSDGIELVVVTTSAPDGQGEKSHARGVRHIVQFVVTGRLKFLFRELCREHSGT